MSPSEPPLPIRPPDPPDGERALDETESADPRFAGLETWAPRTVLASLLGGQAAALRAVEGALASIERATEAAASRLEDPAARLVYAGAGTSGRLAMLDGAELHPTFDWPRARCVVLLAGGAGSVRDAQEGAEDDADAAVRAVRDAKVGAADVLVALAASGRTPFTLAVVGAANAAGALTIAFANNPDTPLLECARYPILLRTGPEVLAGSTRLAAGTAQKIALNLFSTAVMISLGKVFRGRMVAMRASNLKLRQRAAAMVSDITGCNDARARLALQACDYDIKRAILDVEAGA